MNTTTNPPKFPMQPIGWDETGKVVRFKRNKIIEHIVNHCTLSGVYDMNRLYTEDIDWVDRAYFSQLIGYSVSGWGSMMLSADRREWVNEADGIAAGVVERESLKDCLGSLSRPVIEYNHSTGRFTRNMCVSKFTAHYGFERILSEVSHTRTYMSIEEFSHFLQLLGVTFDDYVAYMAKASRATPSFKGYMYNEPFKSTVGYIESSKP